MILITGKKASVKTALFQQLTNGARARILHYNGVNEVYRNRLMSLGLTPGTEFQVRHVAPLGDPVDIQVRGFYLSLRRNEAGSIAVELL